MLDQNTDRMWFVIGAVIIGAAIIFIANGTLPTLFASVTDTFSEQSDNATSVISDIDVNVAKNYVRDGGFDQGLSMWHNNSTSYAVEVDGRKAVYMRPDPVNSGFIFGGGIWQGEVLEESVPVKITFEAKGITPNAKLSLGFMNTPGGGDQSQLFNLTNSWKTYSFELDTIDISEQRYNRLHIYTGGTESYLDNVRVEVIEEG